MTANPFAALPRYSLIEGAMTRATSGDYVHVSDLAALAAAVPADLAEAARALEEPQPRTLVIHHKTPCNCVKSKGWHGDCRTGIVRCSQCGEQIDRVEIVPNPDFDPTPPPNPKDVIRRLIATVTAQAARIEGLTNDLAEVEALELQHGAVIERLQTALAASEARVAKLVEAALQAEAALVGPSDEYEGCAEAIAALRAARAAITEATQ